MRKKCLSVNSEKFHKKKIIIFREEINYYQEKNKAVIDQKRLIDAQKV